MANNVVRLSGEALRRYEDLSEACAQREEQARLDREVEIKLAREEERRALAEEEARQARAEERIAARTAALVVGALARSRLESAPEPPPPPQLPKPVEQPMGVQPDDVDGSTVSEFCTRHKISRSTLYKEWRRGRGPEFYKVGKTTRISRRAERLWQRQREAGN